MTSPTAAERSSPEAPLDTPHADYPDGWFDEFWESIDPSEDDGITAVRLLGELLAAECIWRDGDHLLGLMNGKSFLAPDDQHLIRRIEAAVEHARNADGPVV